MSPLASEEDKGLLSGLEKNVNLQTSNLQRSNLLACLATMLEHSLSLAIVVLLVVLATASNHSSIHNSSPSTTPKLLDCGNSTAEALTNKCVYDSILVQWVPAPVRNTFWSPFLGLVTLCDKTIFLNLDTWSDTEPRIVCWYGALCWYGSVRSLLEIFRSQLNKPDWSVTARSHAVLHHRTRAHGSLCVSVA